MRIALAVSALLALACGGGSSDSPRPSNSEGDAGRPASLHSGVQLTVLAAADGFVYGIDFEQNAALTSYDVKGFRVQESDVTVEDIGSLTMPIFTSAALWDTTLVVLGGLDDATVQFQVLGGTHAAPQIANLRMAVGYLANLAVDAGALWVAESAIGSAYRVGSDGSVDSPMDLRVASPNVTYGLSARGDRVCVSTSDALFCSDAPGVALAGSTNGLVTPFALDGDRLYQPRGADLVSVSATNPGDAVQTLATLPERIQFDASFTNTRFAGENTIALSGEFLYVAGWQHGLLRVPRAGGAAETIVGGLVVTSVVVAASGIYFTTWGDAEPSTLRRVDGV